MRRPEFAQAVREDRILGVTGTEAAYIAGARWVSPAADLYMESIENAFAAQATRVRLIGPRELTRGERSLDIDIRSFESANKLFDVTRKSIDVAALSFRKDGVKSKA